MPDQIGTSLITNAIREDYRFFLRRSFGAIAPAHKYLHNWHIDCVSEYLMACQAGDIKRLIINVPPRSMKSINVSTAFPAWLLGQSPATQVVCASYGQQLANKLSLDTRLLIESPWYQAAFPDTLLAKDQNEKSKFMTTERGHRIATSVGGGLIGEGGDYLIFDDPVKPDEAMSEVTRENANNWIDTGFMSRGNSKDACFIGVMQRLNEDDVVGHLMKNGSWEHLILPAEFQRKTVYDINGRHWEAKRGDFLHEARMDRAYLDEKRKDLGEYGYAAQFDQRPAPLAGGMIKKGWFNLVDEFPMSFSKIICSWDTASKANAGADLSACSVWGVRNNGYYLLKLFEKRMEYPELKAKVLQMHQDTESDSILIEDKSSGMALIQDLRHDTNIPIVAINPINDKIARMSSASTEIEGGNVYLKTGDMWVEDFIEYMSIYPNVSKMDMGDSISQFLNWAKTKDLRNDNEIDLSTIGGVMIG